MHRKASGEKQHCDLWCNNPRYLVYTKAPLLNEKLSKAQCNKLVWFISRLKWITSAGLKYHIKESSVSGCRKHFFFQLKPDLKKCMSRSSGWCLPFQEGLLKDAVDLKDLTLDRHAVEIKSQDVSASPNIPNIFCYELKDYMAPYLERAGVQPLASTRIEGVITFFAGLAVQCY